MIKENSARLVIALFAFLVFSTLRVYSQEMGKLKIQNIRLVIDGKEVTSPDLEFPFEWSKDSKEYLLYQSGDLTIMAKFRLSTHLVRRSSVRSSALNVIINYYSQSGEEKDKRRSEKIFYLEQERKFDVEELFVYKQGFNNKSVKLNYTGVLLQ